MHEQQLQTFYDRSDSALASDESWPAAHEALLDALEAGRVRAAERTADGNWQAVQWVKRAILTGFKRSHVTRFDENGMQPFFDKASYPLRPLDKEQGVRVVPGGTSIRGGSFVGSGVVVMPPAYVNVGAYVDQNTMVDSHALVGSCAQVGKNVHLSAGAQLGGVLEPINQSPVVVEDEVFIGALCGVFEGFVVRERAVLAAGVVLTAATVVYDLVNECEHRGQVPAGAVVVPGTRPASGSFAEQRSLSVAAPIIVKYRDERTDASTALESALR